VEAKVNHRGRWARSIALFVSLCLAVALNVHAQSRFEGNGRVLGVDEEKRMLFLAHGPIPGFMPPMRHGFEVHQVELLRGLKKGDMVHFVLEVQNEILGISSIKQIEDRE
jgi:Cu/Ag efflux protein CusF